jgi:hypothetical protein
MTPKLSDDVQRFVMETPDGAARFQGADGTTFWVLTEDAINIRRLVQEGIDESERGESAPWDVEDVKAAGRRLKQNRSA